MDFDAFWTTIKRTVLWDRLVRGMPFESLMVKKCFEGQNLDRTDYQILSDLLNRVPEDIKNSEQSIRIYLSHNGALKGVLRKTEK